MTSNCHLQTRWYTPCPIPVIERALGTVHISTYCRLEAERELDAYLAGNRYEFQAPETDAHGYLVRPPGGRPPGGRPPVPSPRDPSPVR